MPMISAAFTTAGNPYNVYNVIRGVQTTGVTQQVGSKVATGPSVNTPKLDINVDDLVAGKIYVARASNASATNRVGRPLFSGDNRTWQGGVGHAVFGMNTLWFAVDTDGVVVHIDYE